MKTPLDAFIVGVTYKDNMNAYKTNDGLYSKELLAMLKDEVKELEEALVQGTKKEAILSEIADIGVFSAMLYNKINNMESKYYE